MHQATAGPSPRSARLGAISNDPCRQQNAVSSLLTGTACLHGAAPASAQGNTGFDPQRDLGCPVPDLGSGTDGAVELKEAFVFGAAPGDCFPWVRRELNGSYRKSDTAKVKAQGQSVSGKGDAAAAVGLFNVYFDPDLGVPVHPHRGGGVGGAYVKLETGDDPRSGSAMRPAPSPATSRPASRTMARGTSRQAPAPATCGSRAPTSRQRRRRQYGRGRRRRRHLPEILIGLRCIF